VVIQNGLGYDSFMNRLEAAAPNDRRSVVAMAHVLGISGDGANPHLWYDAARAVVVTYLLLALTTAEAVQVVAVLLVLTLVITPAAACQRLAVNPATAIVPAMLIAAAATEGGILLSLESGPSSFWISALPLAVYLAARAAGWGRLRSWA
jgi:ABC 3 transport family